MIFKPFAAALRNSLAASDLVLPLSESDLSRLTLLIPEGETLPLVLRDPLYAEEILARNVAGTVMVERGQGETEPRKFPRGTCLTFEVTLTVVRDQICNYDCCAEGDCPCELAAPAGVVLPPAQVGAPWQGSVIFSGDLPILLGATGLPAWVSAETGPNYVKLSGIPAVTGSWNISVAAANCQGAGLALQNGLITAV